MVMWPPPEPCVHPTFYLTTILEGTSCPGSFSLAQQNPHAVSPIFFFPTWTSLSLHASWELAKISQRSNRTKWCCSCL